MKDCNISQQKKHREKDRSVKQAFEGVLMWREIYENGIKDENGNTQIQTLQQAAHIVNIPKKTLEYYSQIFKKLKLISNLEQFMDKRMGDLRQYLQENKQKIKKQLMENKKINTEKKKLLNKQKRKIRLEEKKKQINQAQIISTSEQHDDKHHLNFQTPRLVFFDESQSFEHFNYNDDNLF